MAIPYHVGDPLTCQQIRELDVLAIEHVGIPGIVLMENAARAAAEFIYSVLVNPPRANVVVMCGPGNNGGDGFVVARHLRNAGVPVTVVLAAPPERYKADAATNFAIYRRLDAELIDATAEGSQASAGQALARASHIVDALLGTGSHGAPRGLIATLIGHANANPRAARIAIDIPSGLDGDSGQPADPCFRADATVTFVACKVGFLQPAAADHVGRIVVADIGIPRELIPGRAASGGPKPEQGG